MRRLGDPLHLPVGIGAVSAPTIHTITDIAEWPADGFSASQLWANYVAFVALPFVMIGLYACQRPRIGTLGLAGALLYGASFVYFSHTSLFALAVGITDHASFDPGVPGEG